MLKPMDLNTCSDEEIGLSIIKMNSLEIQETTKAINSFKNWKEKTFVALKALKEAHQLESMGKALSEQQFLAILDAIADNDQKLPAKLLPLIVGLNHQVFCSALDHFSEDDIMALKLEGNSEAVHHHLNIFAHTKDLESHHFIDSFDKIEREILSLNIDEMTFEDLDLIRSNIDKVSHQIQQSITAFNKALAIAWNTNRIDLIDKLSQLKERFSKQEQTDIELFDLLNQKFEKVYGNPYNNNDVEALDDNAPAIEGLIKFSLWYLIDYWEIGLLPSIQSKKEIDFESSQKQSQRHERLLSDVQDNLQKIGLKTVGDLKQAQIYSKKMLTDYIKQNLSRLSK